jgi:hypothetical protein
MSKENIRYIIRGQVAEEVSGKTWDNATDEVMLHITLNVRMDLSSRIHRPILDNVFIQVDQDLKNV